MNRFLQNDVKFLPGVGSRRAEILLRELGVATCEDLLYTFPFRYIDRTRFYKVNELTAELPYVQLRGRIVRFREIAYGERQKRFVATFADDTGAIDLVFFRGLKWIQGRLKTGVDYIVFGKPSVFRHTLNLVHPDVDEPGADSHLLQSALQGVYRSSETLQSNGLGQRAFLRLQARLLTDALERLDETLPDALLRQYRLMPLAEALLNIHFPQTAGRLRQAQYRLKFEELFYIQLSLLRQRHERKNTVRGYVFSSVGAHFTTCYNHLPFPLTAAQRRVIKEIRHDLRCGAQMNRLLQGDVGSGKTLVALLCMLLAADNGYQSCIMAPTEILAQQHFHSLQTFLRHNDVGVGLLTGSTRKKERRPLQEQLADGSLHILVGTHALIEDAVRFKNLGLAVVDEQHRFGVEQRARLWNKSPQPPHILVMTATPIPRTLAMTIYGDLDVSIIDELPPGRQPVKTVFKYDARRADVYRFMREQIKAGRQIYVVYPLIKESETMDYKNLEEGCEHIAAAFPPPEYQTVVVHGQMSADEKQSGMQRFVRGEAQIMVATSVIEVGVNVPNATVMLIESAERFGLSQLHQLRGRVGRGAQQSFCILMTGYKLTDEARRRMELMTATNNGFEIANADLSLRGPGDLEGTMQSGQAFDLRIADLSQDARLLEYVRQIADGILADDPALADPRNAILLNRLAQLKNNAKNYSKIS